MASHVGEEAQKGQRKKRAWRKPREPVTPNPEVAQISSPTPIKLQRVGHTVSEDATTKIGSTDVEEKKQKTADHDCEVDTGLSEQDIGSEKDSETCTGNAGCVAVMEDASSGRSHLSLDGSIMEGGGQILRIAMALSCILKRPIHITQIRAGRDKPGLRPQHLAGIELLSQICTGKLKGGIQGSSEITFQPQRIRGGEFLADSKTAGSVCLMLQTCLPVLLFADGPSKVILRGGTNADMAPPIDYFLMVFQIIAAKFGVKFDCQVKRRGFYPKGRGEIGITTSPIKNLSCVNLTEPGSLTKIRIHAFTAGTVSRKASYQMIKSAKRVIKHYLSAIEREDVTIEEEDVQETPDSAYGNSSGIIVVAESSTGCVYAGSANGRKGIASDETGRIAGEELIKNLKQGGCVDEHLQDQLIVLMALARGTSHIKTGSLTLHTETAIHIAENMSDGKAKFKVEHLRDGVNIIHCEGIGLEA